MQRREGPPSEDPMNWPGQMPQLTNRQLSTDFDDLLLSADTNIENFLDEDLMDSFEECFRSDNLDATFAPMLDPMFMENSNSISLPSTSYANVQGNPINMPNISNMSNMPNMSNVAPPNNVLAQKLIRSNTQNQIEIPNFKAPFDEAEIKVANFMAKIPFCSTSIPKNEPRPPDLDFSYNSELDVAFHLRKFDYYQLLNKHAKLIVKVKALASLLKFEVEEEHDYFMLRSSDVVIQICVDHKSTFTNCLTSWYGANLRVNDKLKSLIQHNRWLSILRLLKTMNSLIPTCVPMNERINCLNGLIILEHDLSLLFKEDQLDMQVYGKSGVDVYRPRTDLTPYTIAIHWEFLKSNLAINEAPQFDLPDQNSLYVYLTVVYNEFMTLLPTTSCLNKLQWAEMTTGIHSPGKYCLNFSRPMIVRNTLLKELLELDSAVYTVRPINWLTELSSTEFPGQSLVFTKKKTNNESHRYLFTDSLIEKREDYLVRRITFNSPKTVVGLLMKLRRQACFNGLLKNLFDQFEKRKHLPYNERLIVQIESEEPTTLTLQFNNNNVNIGTVTISTKNTGFEVRVCMVNGVNGGNDEKIEEWNALLNKLLSIPTLMHKIIMDLKLKNSKPQLPTLEHPNILLSEGPQFKKFEYLQNPFIINKQSKKQLAMMEERRQILLNLSTSSSNPKNQHITCHFLDEFLYKARKPLKIQKSLMFNSVQMPNARLRAFISLDPSLRVVVTNKADLTRVPKFLIDAKTPTILPSVIQQIREEKRRKELKIRLERRKKMKNEKAREESQRRKKPSILKSTTINPKPLKTVRLGATSTTSTNLGKNTSIPDSNAQPAKSNLKKKLGSQRVTRFGLARKLVQRRRVKRFFGILTGWRKLYKTSFRYESETRKKLSFEQKLPLEAGTLLSDQSENVYDPKLDPLPSPDYYRRNHLTGFPIHSLIHSNSFGVQNNYNLNNVSNVNAQFPNLQHSNIMSNQPNLSSNFNQKRSNDFGDNRRLDLNASDLAARRKERHLNNGNFPGMDGEMQMSNESGQPFEDSDEEEECDPPPPQKTGQQQISKDILRRKRDQELRDQRQEKINKMVLEKQKEVQKQEEEFAQRHQLPIRHTRNLSNAGISSNSSFNQDSQSNISLKGEEKYHEYGVNNDQSFPLKLPRGLAETVVRKNSKVEEKSARISRKKLRRSSSDSSSTSSMSSSSSSQKSQPKRSINNSQSVDKKIRKTSVVTKSADSHPTTSSKQLPRKISRGIDERSRPFVGKEEQHLNKRRSSDSSSSSSTSDSSSGSSSSDSRPPQLTDRLNRQNSTLTDSLQQDEESRQSMRSNSSIPPLVLASNELKGGKDVRNSRKASSISACAYPFELEAGTKAEFDDPESPTFSQLLSSSKGDKKQKSIEADKSKSSSKALKEKSKQKLKIPEVEKPKKLKSDDSRMSIDKIADRLKEKDRPMQKVKVVQKEGEKLKDKSIKPSPRLQPLPDVFDVPVDKKVLKRKIGAKDPTPKTTKPLPKDLSGKDIKLNVKDDKIPKDHKSLKDLKDPNAKPQEVNKELKPKRPKEVKLLQEIPASPVVMQTRKRSPLPRSKNEPSKKARPSDPEFKPSTSSSSAEKSLRNTKSGKPDDVRPGVKRTLSTSQTDEKRRKVRKTEKSDEKLKEPETPTKKKPTSIFSDLPEFHGRPSLSALKNFKIPKVADDPAKVEKEAEVVKEKEKEVQEEPVREKEPLSKEKEQRPEGSRDRWEKDERRDNYSHSVDRRDSHTTEPYRNDAPNFFPVDTGPREHFHTGRGGGTSGYYGRSKFPQHGNYPPAHRGPGPNYESSPVYNERGGGNFRKQRVAPLPKSGSVAQYDDRYVNPEYSPQHSSGKGRVPPPHFMPPPHHKKSLTESIESPSYQQTSRPVSNPRRGKPFNRDKQGQAPWANYAYQEEVVESRDYPPLMPPSNSSYATFSAPAQRSFQSPPEEQFNTRDQDFRPLYHRGEAENSGPDSPSNGLQIDENA